MSVAQKTVSGALSSAKIARLEALFERYDRRDHPGLAIAVVRAGEIAWQRCYGLANLEDEVPVVPDTVFRIGSVTKHLTATLVLMLEDRGLLGLDEIAAAYLPELPECARTVTLRHLLTMTSGLPDGLVLGIFAGRGERPLTRAQHLRLAARLQELTSAPGDGMLYSNTGYLLLSLLIERLTGRALTEVMRTELFEPLGMLSARLDERALMTSPHKAKGYVPTGDGQYVEGLMLYDASGDGGVDMSIVDFARWLAAYRAETLLGRGYRARMEAEVRLADGSLSDYRLGLHVDAQHGLARVGHSGGMAGYLADLALFPEHDIGVVMLSNLMDVSLLDACDQVAEALTDVSRGFAHPGPADGFYLDAEAGMALQVDRDQEGAAVCHMMGDRSRLLGDPRDGWTPAKRGSGYGIGPASRDGALPVRFGSQEPMCFERWTTQPEPQAFADLVGVYRSAVVGETHFVRESDDRQLEVTLDSAVRELAWGPLTQRARDVFTATIPSQPSASNLTLKFERDGAGCVTGFRYSTFRCRHILFERVTT